MKGLKKLVGEINRNHDLNVNIMIYKNINTMICKDEIWGDFFPDSNSWNEYKISGIRCVGKIRNEPFRGGKVTQKQIMEMVENNYNL